VLIFEVSGWQEMRLASTRVRHQKGAAPRQRWQPTGRVQLGTARRLEADSPLERRLVAEADAKGTRWEVCEPATKGSAQAFVVPGRTRAVVVNDNRRAAPWAALVREAAQRAVAAALPPWQEPGPVEVEIQFYLPRPKSHYRKRLHGQTTLRPDVPAMVPTKPDGDKLLRCCWDALIGVCFKDDSQIVRWSGAKYYADPHPVGARICVRPILQRGPQATCGAHATPPGGAL